MHDAVHVPVPQPPKVQCFEFLLREDTGMERIRSLEFIVVVLKARLLIAMALYKIPMYIKEMYMIYMRMIFPIIQPRLYPRIHPQDVWNWATDFFSDFFCTSDYKILSNDFAALCHKKSEHLLPFGEFR